MWKGAALSAGLGRLTYALMADERGRSAVEVSHTCCQTRCDPSEKARILADEKNRTRFQSPFPVFGDGDAQNDAGCAQKGFQ